MEGRERKRKRKMGTHDGFSIERKKEGNQGTNSWKQLETVVHFLIQCFDPCHSLSLESNTQPFFLTDSCDSSGSLIILQLSNSLFHLFLSLSLFIFPLSQQKTFLAQESRKKEQNGFSGAVYRRERNQQEETT